MRSCPVVHHEATPGQVGHAGPAAQSAPAGHAGPAAQSTPAGHVGQVGQGMYTVGNSVVGSPGMYQNSLAPGDHDKLGLPSGFTGVTGSTDAGSQPQKADISSKKC